MPPRSRRAGTSTSRAEAKDNVIKDAPTLQVFATNSVGETVDATPAPVDTHFYPGRKSSLLYLPLDTVPYIRAQRYRESTTFRTYCSSESPRVISSGNSAKLRK